jgi:hypothetical protein
MKHTYVTVFAFSAVVLSVAVVVPSMSTSAATSEHEDTLKQRGSQVTARHASPLSAEEVRVLDEQYHKRLVIEDEIDKAHV